MGITTIFAREPYQVYLKPKSILIALDDHKEIVTQKGMYVWALEENPNNRSSFWIYNNKKEKMYITSANNIFEHDPELRLLPSEQERENKMYWQKRIRQEPDENLAFDTNVAMHAEQLFMGDFNGIYLNETGNNQAIRYEMRTLYKTGLPWQLGLNLNLQNIFMQNGGEDVRLTILSLGPSFSYSFYQNNTYTLALLASAEIAPIAKASSALNTDNYSNHIYDVGLEGSFPTTYGFFTLGTHLRQQFLEMHDTTRNNLGVVPNECKITSLGISLGYKIDWDL